jgi:hypothetical protein
MDVYHSKESDTYLCCDHCHTNSIAYSGKTVFSTTLPCAPLCLDVRDGYIAVGLIDGRISCHSISRGAMIMEFYACEDAKVTDLSSLGMILYM